MVLQQLNRVAGRFGAVALALGLAVSVCGPALAGPIGAVGDVYVSSSGATAGNGIYQFDGASGAPVVKFADMATVMDHTWGPDGNLYVAAYASFGYTYVHRFDGNTGAFLDTVISRELGDGSVFKGLTFGPDGDLYVGNWFLAQVDRYAAGTFAWKAGYQAVPGDGLGTPNGVEFAPNGNLLVISGGYNKVLEFDTSGNGVNLLGTFADLPGTVQPQDLTFGPNGNLFVTAGSAGGVIEVDGSNGAYVGDFVPHNSAMLTNGLVFDDYGRLLVSTNQTGNRRVVAYDSTTGALLGDFFPHQSGGIRSPLYITIKPVPEPATIGLLLVAGVAFRRPRVGRA